MAYDSPASILYYNDGTPVKFGIEVSTNNSTTVPLGAGASFTGVADDLTNFHEIDINLAGAPANATGVLYFEFSPDGTNWDVSVPLTLDGPTFVPLSLRIILPFFRVRYVNDATIQTEFRLTTVYHYQASKTLTRFLNQYIDYNEPVENMRAFIAGERPDSSFGNVPVSRDNFLRISVDDVGPTAEDRLFAADKSLFGNGVVLGRISQISADFSLPLAGLNIYTTTSGTGTVTEFDGYVELATNTGASATARITTNESVTYAPAREMYVKFAASFTSPTDANSYQRVGIYDDLNGLYVGYDGTTFGLGVRRNGVDTFTPLTGANGDVLDGNPNSRFTRDGVPESLDPTLANIYRIRYGGSVAPVFFQVMAPDSQWVTIHVVSDANSAAIPVIDNPNLPINVRVSKTSSDSTDLRVRMCFIDAGFVADVTNTQLTTLNSKFSSLGQKTMAESVPVTMASNQRSFPIEIEDFPSQHIDSFHRLRVSNPQTLFDSKQVYDQQTLFWTYHLINSATQTYNQGRASTILGVSNSGDTAVRQSLRYWNYQAGKALRHGEPILTPTGWVNVQDIKTGDMVFDGKGNVTEVLGVYHQGIRQIYRITFDDGTHVDCDGEHLWKTIIRQGSQKGQERVLTTNQMLEEYGEDPPVFARWRIPSAPVLNTENREVPLDPYTLGAILGDSYISRKGNSIQLSSADLEIVDNLEVIVSKHKSKYGYGLLKISQIIRNLDLAGTGAYTKFVPDIYKYNSYEVRLAVLQGLMDTDGTVDKDSGCATFSSSSIRLAEDVAYLTRSLGGQAKITSRNTFYTNEEGERHDGEISYRVTVIMPTCPFLLTRKANLWKPRTRVSFDRYIYSIKPLCNDQATCIRVASEDHTFITRGHIVTHNSHQIFMTFVLGEATPGIVRRVGYFDGYNGIFLEQNGTTDVALVVRSNVSGSVVDTRVVQTDWNMNKFDGYVGTADDVDHEKTEVLDLSKAQVMIIDFAWLGTGSVRVGFATDDSYLYAHIFGHPNLIGSVYMATPNLPVRYEITSTTSTDATLECICASVNSEGGQIHLGAVISADRGISTVSIASTAVRPVIAIRLKAAQIRRTVVPLSFQVYPSTKLDIYWCLIKNPVRGTGTAASWTSVNSASAVEYDITSTQALTGGTVIFSGYIAAGSVLDIRDIPDQTGLGAQDYDGLIPDEFVVAARAISSTEAVLGSISWVEL